MHGQERQSLCPLGQLTWSDPTDGSVSVWHTHQASGSCVNTLYVVVVKAQPYADEHSLSIQRALDIVCGVAGSSQASLQDIAQRQILPEERLQRCPAEYRQQEHAWKTLLKPHLRTS